MAEALVLRSIYPEKPPSEVVLSFRKHVAMTGQPETFSTISTERPPTDGQVEALFHPVDINRARRPDRDLAPCPICSPSSPKYVNGGALIWCAATQAIYAIGPDCHETLWGDGRMNRALNALRQSDVDRANAEKLINTVTLIPAHRAWIAEHRQAVRGADRLHCTFREQAPKMRSALNRWYKGNGGSVPLLTGRWNIERDLDAADIHLAALWSAYAGAVEDRIFNLAPGVINAQLDANKDALRALHNAVRFIADAAAFMSENNTMRLAALQRSERAPSGFRFLQTAAAVTLRTATETWTGSSTIAAPEPLPR